MRILVIGATGFISPAVLRRLAGRGHEAVGLARSGADLTADRNDADAVAPLADGADAVVDLLGFTEAATRPLLEALRGRVGRYVLASSGDVYRQ